MQTYQSMSAKLEKATTPKIQPDSYSRTSVQYAQFFYFLDRKKTFHQR